MKQEQELLLSAEQALEELHQKMKQINRDIVSHPGYQHYGSLEGEEEQ